MSCEHVQVDGEAGCPQFFYGLGKFTEIPAVRHRHEFSVRRVRIRLGSEWRVAAEAPDLIGDETAAVVLQRDEERETVVLLVRLTRLNLLHHGRRTYGCQSQCQLWSDICSVEHRPITDSRVGGECHRVGCEAAAEFRQPGDTRHEHLKRRSLRHERVALAALRHDVTPHSRQSLVVVYPPHHAERTHVIAACLHWRHHARAQDALDRLSVQLCQRIFGLKTNIYVITPHVNVNVYQLTQHHFC